MSVAIDTAQDALKPLPAESYAQFVQRAHYALMAKVPEWEERNQQVWDAWERHSGEPLRERAQRYFAKHRFVPNVCYFSEHETIGSDGKPVRYSFSELEAICNEHNSRADKHNYSALASKHTVDGQIDQSQEPRVVGYVGSARLGMVGNQSPQWAAFFDEHHETDSYSQGVLADKKRRSVEVNRYRDGRAPYFDPVAVLGADSPRLPLPVARYADDQATVERYSVMAPAMVSGTNSFIPKFGSDEGRKQYSEGSAMGISPEDVDAIVNAVRSTPEMQWVQQQMKSGGGGQPQPQPAAGGQPPHAHQQPGGQYGQHQLPRYEAKENDDLELVERYEQTAGELAELKDKYAKVHEVNTDLMTKYGETRKAVVELEKKACDSDREMKVKDLYQKFPNFINADEELDRCLYSRGSEMTTDQFCSHLESLERYAERSSPFSKMVPDGQLPDPKKDTDQYEQQLTERVVDRYTKLAAKGDIKTWDELEAEVRAELTGKAD